MLCCAVLTSCTQKKSNQDKKQQEFSDPRLIELSQSIKNSPYNHELLHKRALLYLELKMPYEALSDIGRAIQLSPQNTQYTITLADIYFSMGHIENSRKALISAHDNDPANTEPILKLAELDLILKDYDKMNLYLNKVLELDKNNAQAYFMRGIALKERGDSHAALKQLHLATTYEPEFCKAFLEAGILAYELKNPAAEEYFFTAININPKSIEARYALAMFYQENKMFEQAMQQYHNIIVIDSNYPYAHFNLGYIHLTELLQYEQAIKYFTQSINSKPDYAEAHYNRGLCYELTGDFKSARSNYIEALNFKTNYQKAIDGLNRIER